MAKLILSTGNIVSGGPSFIRKAGATRSNHELTTALRSNFLAAQLESVPYPAVAETNGNGNGHVNGNGNGALVNGNGNGNGAHLPEHPPLSAWTAQEGDIIYVPRIDWGTAWLQEEPSQYDITVKLFFLPGPTAAARAKYAREALVLVLKELGVPSVDLLIASFPEMSFEGNCEWEADKQNAKQGNDEDEFATWAKLEELHNEGLVKNLGIAEFGSEKLANLLSRVQVAPTVNQINIKNCCNVPPPLATLAKERKIELLVHTDCTDILPKGTLREILGQGPDGAGVLAADPETAAGDALKGDLTPQWVVKYTAVVRDRGVIENKGYFAAAQLTEA